MVSVNGAEPEDSEVPITEAEIAQKVITPLGSTPCDYTWISVDMSYRAYDDPVKGRVPYFAIEGDIELEKVCGSREDAMAAIEANQNTTCSISVLITAGFWNNGTVQNETFSVLDIPLWSVPSQQETAAATLGFDFPSPVLPTPPKNTLDGATYSVVNAYISYPVESSTSTCVIPIKESEDYSCFPEFTVLADLQPGLSIHITTSTPGFSVKVFRDRCGSTDE